VDFWLLDNFAVPAGIITSLIYLSGKGAAWSRALSKLQRREFFHKLFGRPGQSTERRRL